MVHIPTMKHGLAVGDKVTTLADFSLDQPRASKFNIPGIQATLKAFTNGTVLKAPPGMEQVEVKFDHGPTIWISFTLLRFTALSGGSTYSQPPLPAFQIGERVWLTADLLYHGDPDNGDPVIMRSRQEGTIKSASIELAPGLIAVQFDRNGATYYVDCHILARSAAPKLPGVPMFKAGDWVRVTKQIDMQVGTYYSAITIGTEGKIVRVGPGRILDVEFNDGNKVAILDGAERLVHIGSSCAPKHVAAPLEHKSLFSDAWEKQVHAPGGELNDFSLLRDAFKGASLKIEPYAPQDLTRDALLAAMKISIKSLQDLVAELERQG